MIRDYLPSKSLLQLSPDLILYALYNPWNTSSKGLTKYKYSNLLEFSLFLRYIFYIFLMPPVPFSPPDSDYATTDCAVLLKPGI